MGGTTYPPDRKQRDTTNDNERQQPQKHKIMNNLFSRFDSVLDFSDYLDNGKTQTDFVGCESSQRKENGRDWYGTPNYEFARDLFLYGDAKSADRVNAAGLKKTIKGLQGHHTQIKHFTDFIGSCPCVPNYLSGRPDAMYNQKRVNTPKPVFNVVYNCSASATIDVEEITNAAAAVLGAVVLLENSGARVNLWVTELVKSDRTNAGAVVKIKPDSQKINLRKIAYCICHPSFLRRQMFRYLEVTPNIPKSFVWGYGCPIHDEKIVKEYLTGAGVRDAVIYDHHADGKTPEQIADEIIATTKRK